MAVSPVEFLRQVRQEVVKVTWPTRAEVGATTFMVFVMVIMASIFFALVDWGLGHAVRFILSAGG